MYVHIVYIYICKYIWIYIDIYRYIDIYIYVYAIPPNNGPELPPLHTHTLPHRTTRAPTHRQSRPPTSFYRTLTLCFLFLSRAPSDFTRWSSR